MVVTKRLHVFSVIFVMLLYFESVCDCDCVCCVRGCVHPHANINCSTQS